MLHFWIGYVNLSGPMFGQGQSWTRGGEALAPPPPPPPPHTPPPHFKVSASTTQNKDTMKS